MSDPHLLFSGGTGRSGTTVLAKLLRNHPQVFASKPLEVRCVTESAGILDVCLGPRADAPRTLRVLGFSRYGLRAAFAYRMRHRWWQRTNRLDKVSGLHRGISVDQREKLITDFHRDLSRDRLEAGRAFVLGLARAQGVTAQRYWIDTSPPNIAHADRIHALIPDARFVHMVRDGRDTMASVMAENWGPSDPEGAARWWAARMVAADTALRAVPDEGVLTLSLEELVVSDRDNQYARLLHFLQLPDRPRVRRYFDERMPASRVRPGAWRERVPDPGALEAAYQAAAANLMTQGVPIHEYP